MRTSKDLQEAYEAQASDGDSCEPSGLIEELNRILTDIGIQDEHYNQGDIRIFKHKKEVPVKQLYALYAISKIASTANMG